MPGIIRLVTVVASGLALSAGPQGEQTFRGVLLDANCSPIATEQSRSRTEVLNQGTGVTTEVTTDGVTGKPGPDSPALQGKAEITGEDVSAPGGTERSNGATSGGNSSSAQGTTGAAVIAPDGVPESGDIQSREVASGAQQRYRNCMATATTTKFALYADGAMYLVDGPGNRIIGQQMRNEAFRGSMSGRKGAPQWIHVTVTGTPGVGNSLNVRSIRK